MEVVNSYENSRGGEWGVHCIGSSELSGKYMRRCAILKTSGAQCTGEVNQLFFADYSALIGYSVEKIS